MTEATSDDLEQPAASSRGNTAARIVSQIAYGALATGLVITLVIIARRPFDRLGVIDLATIIDRHGPAVLGIPSAVIVAILLVSLTRALDGPMTLELFGIKSDGASATCIVWIALFLAISLSFRALW
jgi:hypothetical protein